MLSRSPNASSVVIVSTTSATTMSPLLTTRTLTVELYDDLAELSSRGARSRLVPRWRCSYPLSAGRDGRADEGGSLENCCEVHASPWVRIPLPPPERNRASEYAVLR